MSPPTELIGINDPRLVLVDLLDSLSAADTLAGDLERYADKVGLYEDEVARDLNAVADTVATVLRGAVLSVRKYLDEDDGVRALELVDESESCSAVIVVIS